MASSQESTFFQAMARHYQETYEMKSRSGTLNKEELIQILMEIKGWQSTFDALQQNLEKLLPPSPAVLNEEAAPSTIDIMMMIPKLKEEATAADEAVKRLLGDCYPCNYFGCYAYTTVLPHGTLDVNDYKSKLLWFEEEKKAVLLKRQNALEVQCHMQFARGTPPPNADDLEQQYTAELDVIKKKELVFLNSTAPINAAAFRRELRVHLDKKADALRALRKAEMSVIM